VKKRAASTATKEDEGGDVGGDEFGEGGDDIGYEEGGEQASGEPPERRRRGQPGEEGGEQGDPRDPIGNGEEEGGGDDGFPGEGGDEEGYPGGECQLMFDTCLAEGFAIDACIERVRHLQQQRRAALS
jgi:hypothetical protein